MLWGSITLSEFRTSLSKVLTIWSQSKATLLILLSRQIFFFSQIIPTVQMEWLVAPTLSEMPWDLCKFWDLNRELSAD